MARGESTIEASLSAARKDSGDGKGTAIVRERSEARRDARAWAQQAVKEPTALQAVLRELDRLLGEERKLVSRLTRLAVEYSDERSVANPGIPGPSKGVEVWTRATAWGNQAITNPAARARFKQHVDRIVHRVTAGRDEPRPLAMVEPVRPVRTPAERDVGRER